jgi:hypothetical protein
MPSVLFVWYVFEEFACYLSNYNNLPFSDMGKVIQGTKWRTADMLFDDSSLEMSLDLSDKM